MHRQSVSTAIDSGPPTHSPKARTRLKQASLIAFPHPHRRPPPIGLLSKAIIIGNRIELSWSCPAALILLSFMHLRVHSTPITHSLYTESTSFRKFAPIVLQAPPSTYNPRPFLPALSCFSNSHYYGRSTYFTLYPLLHPRPHLSSHPTPRHQPPPPFHHQLRLQYFNLLTFTYKSLCFGIYNLKPSDRRVTNTAD